MERKNAVRFVAACLLSPLIASCTGGQSGARDASTDPAKADDARVVVAAIDSGVNAYHQFFYEGGPNYPQGSAPGAVTASVLEEFAIPEVCQLSLTRTGDFAADFAADANLWRRAQACAYVWFVGTNLIARSNSPGSTPYLPDDEGDTHGIGVTAAVLNANPEAIVVFYEGTGSVSESEAFTHPAVDFITTSYGFPGSPPVPGHLENSFTGVWANGKMHFGACDNTPAPGTFDTTCGPWWSIGIAGFEETADNEPDASSGGRQPLSGTFPDFIADFTQTLPYCQACEDGYSDYVGGTSFATPRSAGIASKILLQARRQLGHTGGIIKMADGDTLMAAGNGTQFTNWQLRRALEQAAWIPEFGDYDVVASVLNLEFGVPLLPVAAYTQAGWGVLTTIDEAQVVARSLAALGLGDADVPAKELGYCEFQTAQIAVRKLYWDNLNVGSETFLAAPDEDPFVPCL